MHLLKLVWAVSLCIVHGDSEGKPRLHPHRAFGDQDGDMAMSISATGQPVMRREAKQDSAEERHDEMPTEHQQLALERALHRVAELSEDLNPDIGYRESLLKKVKEIMDHDDVHEQKQRTAQDQGMHHQMASSKFMPKALVALSDVMPIKVDGCQDAATAKVIEGYYVPAGTTSGKPSYKKDGSGSGEDEVWLYHYADIDAGSVGWWIGSNPSGRVHIYAFNPSKAELPPSSGWKAPWWGDVDSNLLVETLSQEEVPQDLVPTETPEEEMVTEAPEAEDSFTVTEAPEESVEMATTAPEMEEKAEKLEHKASSVGKDMDPSELQHVLKEEGEMITAAVAKLSSGKKLADMVFGTDTAVIPAEPPSAEMLEKLAKDPELAKKALNRTVSILQGAVSRLESGEAFANELLGTNTSRWLQTTEEVVNASMVPISKHGPRQDNKTDAAEEEGSTTTTEPPIEGSAAAPLMKKVDEVAVAAEDAAEKARLWKDAEIAGLHAKQAAEEAKKKVEKLTVQAAKEEAEKAIEEAAGSETAEAKEEAGKLAAKAHAEVADKETEVAKAKKKLVESASAEDKAAAEKELTAAEEAVKKATVKAGVLEKKADDIKVEHKESDDNALYSSGDEAEESRIIMGSEPKSDGEKVLEDKLDILQSKLQGLERVQMKDKLEDTLSASLTEVDENHGIRLLASEPKDVNGPTDEDEDKGGDGEKKDKKKGRKEPKGSWNRITIFVMAALMVGVLACGAVYQLVVIRRMKQQAKVEEKQPLMKEEDTAAGNPGGATEEVVEDPAPAGS